jgi:ABC-2 type transport system permease protein
MNINLLKAESIKLLNNRNLKILLGLHLIFFILVLFVTARMRISFPGFTTENLFRFPWIWNITAWLASWFNILLALLVIMITCNEYSFRTFRQNIIDGLSRGELFAGKSAMILILALYAVLLVSVTSLVPGLINTDKLTLHTVFSNAWIAGVFFIQAVAYMFLAFLIANLLKNTAFSIIAFLMLRLIAEPVIRLFFNPTIRQFFPFKIITGLTPAPGLQAVSDQSDLAAQIMRDTVNLNETGLIAPATPLYVSILVTLIYTFIFALASWLIISRRDF